MSKWGIKVSQEGNDVLVTKDENLVMSSEFNMFKIVKKLTATHTITTTDTTHGFEITVYHGQLKAPFLTGSMKFNDGTKYIIPTVLTNYVSGSFSVPSLSISFGTIDDTSVKVKVSPLDSAGFAMLGYYEGTVVSFELYCMVESIIE